MIYELIIKIKQKNMLKLSKFPFKTLKSKPNISDNKSTSILLQAGFIRQTMA
jgi:prolyl-tRNA synthetase